MVKADFVDSMGKPLTQSLFLEIGYTDKAIYTLKDEDYEYNGKVYPSIKRLYMQCADPTEYTFATEHFLGWTHWQRIAKNRSLAPHVAEWREELEVMLRCQGIKSAISSAKQGGFQAAKWLADRGWESRGAGRPSKAEVERETKFQARVNEEYDADILRLVKNA